MLGGYVVDGMGSLCMGCLVGGLYSLVDLVEFYCFGAFVDGFVAL
jgi:hypothetical protein